MVSTAYDFCRVEAVPIHMRRLRVSSEVMVSCGVIIAMRRQGHARRRRRHAAAALSGLMRGSGTP